MKCGIMTFHRAINYGGVLQAYALNEYINKKIGVDSEIIDYRCENIESMYKYSLYSLKPKVLLKYFYKLPLDIKKKIKFNRFIKKYIKKGNSTKKSELPKCAEKYDIIITGSDQVWGKSRINVDHSYFLDFVRESKKKASYAASFGAEKIESEFEDVYRGLLKDFSHLCVREKTGADIIKKITNASAEVCIDPTLLLDKTEWGRISSTKLKDEKYLLIYMLTNSNKIVDTARKIAEKYGLKIYNISDGVKEYYGIKNLRGLSPAEWVGAFLNSSYVVTNSFHGTAFAVNFNKNFNTEVSTAIASRGSRITDLLKLLNLSDRLINNSENISEISYDMVNKILYEERKKSYTYLVKLFS